VTDLAQDWDSRRTFLRWLAASPFLSFGLSCSPERDERSIPDADTPRAPRRRAPALQLSDVIARPQDALDVMDFEAVARQKLPPAHFGYIATGVDDDATVQANRDGYRRIWLVGISLGGFASLGLLMRQSEAIEGVLTIAPYVGQPTLLQQVAAAGGAVAYAERAPPSDDLAAELWLWIGRSSPALRHKIHLYTGRDDRLISGQRLLESVLETDHVVEVPGGHDWPAWNALWARWLAHAPWPRTANA